MAFHLPNIANSDGDCVTISSGYLRTDQALHGAGPRSLWGAGLVNLLAQTAMGLTPTMAVRDAIILHLDEARGIGVAPIIRPDLLTAGWFAELPIVFGLALACVLPGTLLFPGLVERTGPGKARSLLGWALAGTVSASPLAIGLCVLAASMVHLPMGAVFYLLVGAVPWTIGLCGAVAAWHFRYGARWSLPS